MVERAFKDIKREVQHVPDPAKADNTPENQPPDVVQLQRYLGNQAVQRLMKEGRLQLSGSNDVLQAKLTVTSAGDQYEQEADRVAQQVVHGTGAETAQRAGEEDELQMKRDFIQREDEGGELEDEQLQMKRDVVQREGEEDELQMKRDVVQREGEEDELQMKRDVVQREGEEDELQMKSVDPADSFDVGGDLEQTIQAQRGSGQSMPDHAKGFFENGFGQDFSSVRIHDNKESDALNQSLSARAFTVGSDIFFRSGEYDPSGDAGKELIAHELTHVVQQGGSKVQKKEDE
jgi:hypothetical protein